MGDTAEAFARTWARRGHNPWSPFGVVRQACGCRWDNLAGRMWEPCRAHEAEGHLSAVTERDGLVRARCLVRDCDWGTDVASEWSAVLAAQDHWTDTREERRRAE